MDNNAKKKCLSLGIAIQDLDVRLINVDLPGSDEQEVLITSLLDPNDYPYKDFIWLYHQRWFIEESYKCLKFRLEIENFTGFSKCSIEQDIHAKNLTKNINACLVAQAQKILDGKGQAKEAKHAKQVNVSNALRKLKDNIVRLLTTLSPDTLIIRLIEAFEREYESVRPDRNFERSKLKTTSKFTMQYKRY